MRLSHPIPRLRPTVLTAAAFGAGLVFLLAAFASPAEEKKTDAPCRTPTPPR